jgi:hypothetical protein
VLQTALLERIVSVAQQIAPMAAEEVEETRLRGVVTVSSALVARPKDVNDEITSHTFALAKSLGGCVVCHERLPSR